MSSTTGLRKKKTDPLRPSSRTRTVLYFFFSAASLRVAGVLTRHVELMALSAIVGVFLVFTFPPKVVVTTGGVGAQPPPPASTGTPVPDE